MPPRKNRLKPQLTPANIAALEEDIEKKGDIGGGKLIEGADVVSAPTGLPSGFIPPPPEFFTPSAIDIKTGLPPVERPGVTVTGKTAAERELESKFAGETGEELAKTFGEAGVFETPQLVPIISPEMENAGVLWDMLGSLVSVIDMSKDLEGVLGKPPISAKEKAQERATETEIALQNSLVNKTLQSEIGKEYDEEIDQVVVEMGLGLSVIAGAVAGGFVSSFAQLIGTDKKVKNLTTGIVKLETIASDIASKVTSGDLSYAEGFSRIETIGLILDDMEAQLQLAAIESANVRISLKGRDVAIKIFSGRSRINTSLNQIAGAQVAGIIQDSPAVQKMGVLADLKQRFKEGS